MLGNLCETIQSWLQGPDDVPPLVDWLQDQDATDVTVAGLMVDLMKANWLTCNHYRLAFRTVAAWLEATGRHDEAQLVSRVQVVFHKPDKVPSPFNWIIRYAPFPGAILLGWKGGFTSQEQAIRSALEYVLGMPAFRGCGVTVPERR